MPTTFDVIVLGTGSAAHPELYWNPKRRLHDSPSGPRGLARGSGSRAGSALYDAPRGHLQLVFLAAGSPAAHRLQSTCREGYRTPVGSAPVGLACRGGHQPLRPGYPCRAAGERPQADGLRLPHERLRHQLHGLGKLLLSPMVRGYAFSSRISCGPSTPFFWEAAWEMGRRTPRYTLHSRLLVSELKAIYCCMTVYFM